MNQFIRSPTHRLGNILGLVFHSDVEEWDYYVHKIQISDHYPILFYRDIQQARPRTKKVFSVQSFDQQNFTDSLNID